MIIIIIIVTNVYEINCIWELRKWNQTKNDRRSCDCNLCNYARSLKKIQHFNEIWTRDLAIPGYNISGFIA